LALNAAPYRLERLGVVMEQLPGEPREVEGVLNPASAPEAKGLWDDARHAAAEQRVAPQTTAADKGNKSGRRDAPEALTGVSRGATDDAEKSSITEARSTARAHS